MRISLIFEDLMLYLKSLFLLVVAVSLHSCRSGHQGNDPENPLNSFERVLYNNPEANADLGVGLWAWPLPMDYDGDGDLDLVVSCPDKPYNGTYFFENPDGNVKMPRFLPGVKIGKGMKNIVVSHPDGKPRVLVSNIEYLDFTEKVYSVPEEVLPREIMPGSMGRQRFNIVRYRDYDGDGMTDLIISIDDWGDYGWDNAFNDQGVWTRGPLHGYVYVARNRGTADKPEYETPFRLQAEGEDIDVFGAPFGDLADYDGDGDLDLLCGEFLDGFNYFENRGTRKDPVYSRLRRLSDGEKEVKMDLQMITPTSIDWDKDGDIDIVAGDEDGRVAFIENTGRVLNGMPLFLQPDYFKQVPEYLKFGALVTPVSTDWDNDGDEDLVCGNTAGYIGFIENLDNGDPPAWAAPVYLRAEGRPIRILAGYNGSIQGPAEAKWGYTTLSVADWDHDGLKDIVTNSIWGKIIWYRNTGDKGNPVLSQAEPIEVEWNGLNPKPEWNWWDPSGKELVTQWRTTPDVVDWDRDGLNDLVMLDHEGFLALFRRIKKDKELLLLPGERIFTGYEMAQDGTTVSDESGLLRLNPGVAGKSGRRKICITDWDGDGLPDLLVNSQNVNFLKNMGDSAGFARIQDMGPLDSLAILAGHSTSPTIVDWNRDTVPDLLVGAEDGHFYYLPHH